MSCFFWGNGQRFNQLARRRYWRHFSVALSQSLFLSRSVSLSSALQVDVTVDLRPMDPEIRLHRDIVLLLRCEKSVNWVIKAHNIIGRLHIVVCRHVYAQMNPKSFLQNVFDQPKHVWCLRVTCFSFHIWAKTQTINASIKTHAGL